MFSYCFPHGVNIHQRSYTLSDRWKDWRNNPSSFDTFHFGALRVPLDSASVLELMETFLAFLRPWSAPTCPLRFNVSTLATGRHHHHHTWDKPYAIMKLLGRRQWECIMQMTVFFGLVMPIDGSVYQGTLSRLRGLADTNSRWASRISRWPVLFMMTMTITTCVVDRCVTDVSAT